MMKHLLKAILLAAAIMSPVTAHAYVGVFIGVAPPAIPVYAQPPIPGDGYIWTPGYWAWNDIDNDYYWVPGTWIMAPFVGALWTPGYWGWVSGTYIWHGGYWGTHIGYYGGINYGFGYTGVGYQGSYWHNGSLHYNQTVNNIGTARINNTYSAAVNVNNPSRVSYNGGAGGIHMAPSLEDKNATFQHYNPTSAQQSHEQVAGTQPQLRASYNGGNPAMGATPMTGQFNTPNSDSQQYAQRPQSAPAPSYSTQNARPAPQVRPVSASPHYPPQQYAQRQPSYAPPMMHQPAPRISYNTPRMSAPHQSFSQHAHSHFR